MVDHGADPLADDICPGIRCGVLGQCGRVPNRSRALVSKLSERGPSNCARIEPLLTALQHRVSLGGGFASRAANKFTGRSGEALTDGWANRPQGGVLSFAAMPGKPL